MPRTLFDPVVRHLHRVADIDPTTEQTDAELLRLYVEQREEAAFTALLERHGGLVMSVCRRILPRRQDAEDAFQATFLTLIRVASSIRRSEAIAGWLYRVAHRIAIKAGTDMARRSVRERESVKTAPAATSAEVGLRELQEVVDEEVRRLPEKFRAPFLLCCLEGKTRTEAARELGWKEGTVAGHLAEARRRLQLGLARRGVALSSALAVAALTPHSEAALSPLLLNATREAALQCAAGTVTGGAISASVAALIQGATRTMFTTTRKTATAVLLLLLGVLTARTLAHHALAARETASAAAAAPVSEGEKAPPVAKADDGKTPADAEDKVEVTGRVIGPDGKAMRGAEVLLIPAPWTGSGEKARRTVRATSDGEGRFRFSASRSEFDRWTTLVAAAPGFGPGWVEVDKVPQSEQTLKLVEDAPITGRILDLEGRPIKGVVVKVQSVRGTPAEDLTPAFQAWQESADRGTAALTRYLSRPGWAGIPEQVTTDAEGRFRITGIGRERLAELKVEGETIQHRVLHVLCRPGADIAALTKLNPEKASPGIPQGPQPAVYGPTFEHVAQPCKTIVGVVKDKATGKPLAGVRINGSAPNHWWGDYAQTTTDDDGRFRLVGVAKAAHYSVSTYAGQPYLPSQQQVSDSEGLKPLTVDFQVVRGVQVKGRITDKETGKPVFCALWYFPLADNKFFQDLPGKDWYHHMTQGQRTEKDGTFSWTVLPGSGVITVRAEDEAMELYTEAVLDPAHKSRVYRDDGEGGLGQSFLSAGGTIESLTGHHAYRLIEPPQGSEPITCDIELDRGRKVTGTVVGPDGKPLSGATVMGLSALGGGPVQLKDASFTATTLSPARARTIAFIHKERKLAGQVVLRGTEKEPVTVKLEPWGAVTGRALDEEGRPLVDAECLINYQSNMVRWLFDSGRVRVKTDQEGRFRVEGLFPGVPFAINFLKKGKFHDPGDKYRELPLKPGETKELGDIKTTIFGAQ
jgi:RNA polymerase sigma factor (sigma-70 family)